MSSDPMTQFFPCMIIVQARMSSTRLPGKVMKEVLGKPLLTYLVERLRCVKGSEGICIATTKDPSDDVIARYCDQESLHCIRGSIDDVLSRYMAAIDAFGLDVAVRVTADCPLFDPDLLEDALIKFKSQKDPLDYLSNTLDRTYPRGMDFEIFRASALRKAYFEATAASDKEHVTPYIWRHPELFRLQNVKQQDNLSNLRLTVDTPEDFELVRRILDALYPKNPAFRLADMVALLKKHPDWLAINSNVIQKAL